MKTTILALALSLASASAFADQKIHCQEINKDYSPRAKGIEIELALALNQDGSISQRRPTKIKLTRVFRKGSEYGAEFQDIYASQQKRGVRYTHINFSDSIDGVVEYQLQFKNPILGQRFDSELATLVVGVDQWSSEEHPQSWGYKLVCSGYTDTKPL